LYLLVAKQVRILSREYSYAIATDVWPTDYHGQALHQQVPNMTPSYSFPCMIIRCTVHLCTFEHGLERIGPSHGIRNPSHGAKSSKTSSITRENMSDLMLSFATIIVIRQEITCHIVTVLVIPESRHRTDLYHFSFRQHPRECAEESLLRLSDPFVALLLCYNCLFEQQFGVVYCPLPMVPPLYWLVPLASYRRMGDM
jgi:hypothetical protein